ncbi:MAG TPA: helix-turn-helix domain-containing protein [Ktedonobacterales bacterium]
MDPEISFGRWLRWRRRALDLTQDALARRVGCSVITIRKLEADERRPSAQIAARLADSLEVPAADRVTVVAFARAGPPLDPSFASPDGSLPWRAPPRPTSNLPAPLTRLIGRKPEVAAVRNALRRGDLRLLTLIGPPGIGKTRLGLEVAADVRDAFADGVYLVALASVSDPTLVTVTIAQTMGVRETGDQPLDVLLRQYLRAKRLLVLLDNCEHLVAAAPDVVALLEACPRLQILATSRAALRVQGERLIPVPPLALPTLAPLPALPALAHTPAVALFIERAQAVHPSFALTEEHAPAVAAICARLEGLPLAIELVAARVDRFTPQALLEGLDHQLTLLAEGSRDLPPRHRSLRAAIGRSDDLLAPAERRLFRRLSVFAGSATPEAVEAVCAAPAEAEALGADLLDTVAALVDHSLLWRREETNGEVRLSLHYVIREYALERLEASGEADALRRAHATYYLRLAEMAIPEIWGSGQIAWLERLENEHDNLRATLGWARDREELELGLRVAVALWRFWTVRGYRSEGRSWLEELLVRTSLASGQSGASAPVGLYALGLAMAGYLAFSWVDDVATWALAAAQMEAGLALARQVDDRQATAFALIGLGDLAMRRRDLEQAAARYQEAREIGAGLVSLRAINLGHAVIGLGLAAYRRGDWAQASVHAEEALAFGQESGDPDFTAACNQLLGWIALRQGHLELAAAQLRKTLVQFWMVGNRAHVTDVLDNLALTAAAAGQAERAARLLGAKRALLESIGMPQLPAAGAVTDRTVVAARDALGEERWMAAFVAGGALTTEEAIAEALSADG